MGSRDRAQPLGREFDEPGPLLERAQQEHAGLGQRHFRDAERLARRLGVTPALCSCEWAELPTRTFR
jgi:hypothetical protein